MKYRSDIERKIHQGKLKNWSYESVKIEWEDAKDKKHKYTADFIHLNGKKMIEVKGYFRRGERTKYKAIKKQNENVELIFAFQDPDRLIRREKITYRYWCDKNGFTCFSWKQLL